MAWIRFQMNAQAMNMPVSFDALLPEKFDGSEKKWKTLYLLHDFGGDRNDWLMKTRLRQIVEGLRVDGCLLMIILPEANNSFFVNLPNGCDYAEFISSELVRFFESNFPVSKESGDRIIAGIGMGGYSALHAALTHPEVFGRAASFEGILDIFSLYGKNAFSSSPSFRIEHIFGPEAQFRGSENDLFTLVQSCGAGENKPRFLMISSQGSSREKEITEFNGAMKKAGLSVVSAALSGNGSDFYDEALRRLIDSLSRGEL